MPIMDGMAATRLIRAGGTEQFRVQDAEVYIIALTANATEKERQEGIAAGMNDYLTKPVSVRGLHTALAHAIRYQLARSIDLPVMPVLSALQGRQTKPNLPSSAEKTWIAKLADWGVAVDEALDRLNGNLQRYQRWLNHFFTENQNFFTELAQSKQLEKLNEYIAQVHAMRGVSGTLGLMDFYTAASDLEQALFAAQKEATEVLPDFSELEGAWHRAQKFILPLVKMESPVPVLAQAEGLLPLASWPAILNLQAALQSNSLRAKKLLTLLLQDLPDTHKNQLNDVAAALDALDYPTALRALNQRIPVVAEGAEHG
jgi:CheY-like chemotaxis protein